ncbi:MAG: GNAT family N-acetyltransferase [Rikenellaceae bacterium]
MKNYDVQHSPSEQKFFVQEQGYTAYLIYNIFNGALSVATTQVPKALEGQGIASALVGAFYDYCLREGLEPRATCSYAVAWLKKHA